MKCQIPFSTGDNLHEILNPISWEKFKKKKKKKKKKIHFVICWMFPLSGIVNSKVPSGDQWIH